MRLLAVGLGVALLVAAPLRDARACAAFAGGEPVPIAREDALIVWDADKHEEHFIRSAVFDTTRKSVGFLVPTPSPPTFAEASDAWTAALQTATAPVVEHRASFVPIGCTMLPFMFMQRTAKSAVLASAPFDDGVHVLEETRVAGMDVAVLDATDAGALAKWLAAHDFEMRGALERWVAPYIAKKWTFSAFRYARPDLVSNAPVVPAIAARAVRITFKTDAPVYPYREPDDSPEVVGRELHLFVVAAARLAGTESDLGAPWSATVPFAAKMAPPAELVASVAGVTLPAQIWVNEFVDHTTKRPATDLVFDKVAAAADEVRRPTRIVEDGPRIIIPYELPFIAVLVAWLWRRRRRRRVTRP